MPVTDVVKQSDSVKRKPKDKSNEVITKRSGANAQVRESSVDNQSRGDDVSPPTVKSSKTPTVKKSTNESTVSTEKTVKTPIVDKVPKKSVQRAKASIALNKTIEEEEKKNHPTETDAISRRSSTTIEDNALTDSVKLQKARSKVKQMMKSARPASEKRVASGKKNWSSVVKKNSESRVKEEEEEEEVPAPEVIRGEVPKKEIDTQGVALSSCSFFEKLQQGVRAYFSSRNSLTEDKPKKKVTEGDDILNMPQGIRTGAGVAKRRKEESNARNQGNKIKNKIKTRASDSFYDRPRLESISEGQMNNPLNKKPKIIQYVKRKKLYHPKKHYVRIQIPRKGYFYRSLEFRPTESETDSVNSPVEPTSLSKKSEMQIARLASTSSERPNIHKKRLKKPRENISKDVDKDDEFLLVHDYLEMIHRVLNQQMIAQQHKSELNRLAMNWPLEIPIASKETELVLNEGEATPPNGDSHSETDKQSCADANDLPDANNRTTEIQKHDNGFEIESVESYSKLETQIQNSLSHSPTAEALDSKSDVTFQTLMQCLRDSLGGETCYGNLGISPVGMTNKDFESNLTHEPSTKFENLMKPANRQTDTDGSFPNSLRNQEEYCVSTAVCEYANKISSRKKKSWEQFTSILMGDIDLHSELQNYLKENPTNENLSKENPAVNKSTLFSDVNKRNSFLSNRNVDFGVDASERQMKGDFSPHPEIKPMTKKTVKFKTNESLRSLSASNVNELQYGLDSKKLSEEGKLAASRSVCEPASEKKEHSMSSLLSLLIKNYTDHGTYGSSERVSSLKLANLTNSDQQALSETENRNSESNEIKKKETIEEDKYYSTDENNEENRDKWRLSLEDLADIYSTVLKQTPKKKSFKKSKCKKSKRLWSNSIIAILKDKLRRRNKQMDFINFTETLKECFQPLTNGTLSARTKNNPIADTEENPDADAKKSPDTDSEENTNLQEFVNMFQEVLLSSLSIEQITYLNNVISLLQNPETSAECFKFVSASDSSILYFKKEAESDEKVPKPTEPHPQNTPGKESKPMAKVAACGQSTGKAKASIKKNKSEEQPKKVALTTPTEFESVLKSFCNSEKNNNQRRTVDKILVNVKLSGNRVLVNNFSYIRDEKFLCRAPQPGSRVSELIIENIAGDRVSDCITDLNEAPKKIPKNPVKKCKNIKIVVKGTKLETQNSTGDAKIKNEPQKTDKRNQNPKQHVNENLKLKNGRISEGAKECKDVSSKGKVVSDESSQKKNYFFQYDQERLKAQHPIDAIIEASESKIENAESSEKIDSKEALANRKNLKVKTAAIEIDAKNKISCLKNKSVKNGLGKTDFSDLPQKRNKTTVSGKDHKTDDDLKFESRNDDIKNRKVSIGPNNSYFCYPSVTVQNKPEKVNKKSVPDSNATKATTSKGVRETDSKPVKTLSTRKIVTKGVKSVKAIKKSDSILVKKSSIKKLESSRKENEMKKKLSERKKKSSVSQRDELPRKRNPIFDAANVLCSTKDNRKVCVSKGESSAEEENDVCDESKSSSSAQNHSGEVSQEESLQSEVVEAIDKCKNTPIVIFSTSTDSDVGSQSAIIRSDSILKTLSHCHINPNKIESVFKTDSDSKFYPGRISESTEDAKPWLTFILTPQQQEQAKLPSNQVKVVEKRKEIVQESEESADDQISLKSMGRFIDGLREKNLKERKKVKKIKGSTRQKKEENSKAERQKPLEKQKSKSVSREQSRDRNIKTHDCLKNDLSISGNNWRRKHEKKHSDNEMLLAKVIFTVLKLLLEEKKRHSNSSWALDETCESENSVSEADEEFIRKWQNEKSTRRILNWAVNKISKYEKVVKKDKLILALKTELRRRKANSVANVDGLLELPKKVGTRKGLQNGDARASERSGNPTKWKEQKMVLLINKEPKSGTEAEVEEEKPSKCSDEEEKNQEETETGTMEPECPSEEPSVEKVSDTFKGDSTEEEKQKEEYTSSDENQMMRKTVSKEIEDIICEKIYENMGKDNVFYSIVLFDTLMRKKGILDEHKKLRNILQTVSEKNRNAIMDLEKNAWIKLYRLLEELSKVYDVHEDGCMSDSVCNYFISQLNKRISSGFNIPTMKMKLADLHNSLRQSKICLKFDLNNIFFNFLTRLNELTTAVFPRLILSVTKFFEDGGICAIKSDQKLNVSGEDPEREARIQSLKNQIRAQRLFIEFLMSARSGGSCAEITVVKNKISQKVDILEKVMSTVKMTKPPCESLIPAVKSYSLNQLTTLN